MTMRKAYSNTLNEIQQQPEINGGRRKKNNMRLNADKHGSERIVIAANKTEANTPNTTESGK